MSAEVVAELPPVDPRLVAVIERAMLLGDDPSATAVAEAVWAWLAETDDELDGQAADELRAPGGEYLCPLRGLNADGFDARCHLDAGHEEPHDFD